MIFTTCNSPKPYELAFNTSSLLPDHHYRLRFNQTDSTTHWPSASEEESLDALSPRPRMVRSRYPYTVTDQNHLDTGWRERYYLHNPYLPVGNPPQNHRHPLSHLNIFAPLTTLLFHVHPHLSPPTPQSCNNSPSRTSPASLAMTPT